MAKASSIRPSVPAMKHLDDTEKKKLNKKRSNCMFFVLNLKILVIMEDLHMVLKYSSARSITALTAHLA